MSTATAQVEITPALMAEAFWGMGSEKQIEFFTELAAVIKENHKTNSSAYSLGELQWFYVAAEMEDTKAKLAREMLMTMASPLYLHALRTIEGQA